MDEKRLNNIIATNIRRLLAEHNKMQSDLAQYVGVSQATVSNWCKGVKVPRMDKLDKICSFFNVARSDIMDEYKPYKPTPNKSYKLTPEEQFIILAYRSADPTRKAIIRELLQTAVDNMRGDD